MLLAVVGATYPAPLETVLAEEDSLPSEGPSWVSCAHHLDLRAGCCSAQTSAWVAQMLGESPGCCVTSWPSLPSPRGKDGAPRSRA